MSAPHAHAVGQVSVTGPRMPVVGAPDRTRLTIRATSELVVPAPAPPSTNEVTSRSELIRRRRASSRGGAGATAEVPETVMSVSPRGPFAYRRLRRDRTMQRVARTMARSESAAAPHRSLPLIEPSRRSQSSSPATPASRLTRSQLAVGRYPPSASRSGRSAIMSNRSRRRRPHRSTSSRSSTSR